VHKSLYIIAQTHLYHFLTTSGQKHVALEEFYTNLNEETDDLAEKLLSFSDGYFEEVKEFYLDANVSSVIEKVTDYRNQVTNIIEQIKDTSSLYSILDSLADIQEEIDKFVYKYSLE
jgi:DNA-binding ferritin-like protein